MGSIIAQDFEEIVAAVIAIIQLLGLVCAMHAVMTNRSTQGTIAWSLSLVIFPTITIPLYLMFGRNRLQGYIQSRKLVDAEFRAIQKSNQTSMLDESAKANTQNVHWNLLNSLGKFPFTRGNTTTLLKNGEQTFNSIYDGFERAHDYILIQFFIIRNDRAGREFANKLIEAAQRGIRVFFLVDALGSRNLPRSYFNRLKDAGIETGQFLPKRFWKGRLRINFRNHRKIVVVDGKEAWIGGLNVGDEYFGRSRKFGSWRDTHIHIKGPAVDGIQLPFLEDWFWTKRSMPPLNWQCPPVENGNKTVLTLATGPVDIDETCSLAYLHLINNAKRRIWIQSPYFVPDDQIVTALQLAERRGVDVRILLPEKPDHFLVWFSSFYFVSLPQLRNIRFFRYRPGFLHSKTAVFDHDLSIVGTINLDNRSFRINFEIAAIVADREFNQQCSQMMLDDFQNSHEVNQKDYEKRPLPFRIATRAARLLSPLQ